MALLFPFAGIANCTVVVRPVVVLATVVSGNFSPANRRPSLPRIQDQDCVVSDGTGVIIHIMASAERLVMPAIPSQLTLAVNQKMPVIQMLMRCESVPRLEKKVGSILSP